MYKKTERYIETSMLKAAMEYVAYFKLLSKTQSSYLDMGKSCLSTTILY